MKTLLLTVGLSLLVSTSYAQDIEGAKAKITEAQRALDAATALLTVTPPPAGQTIVVPIGGNLQAAINAAQPGDTITLVRGATYTGSFVLPATSGTAYITLRTQGDTGLPAAGTRVTPTSAPLLAKLKSPTSEPAIKTAPGAHHWRLQLLELQANQGGFSDILRLGDGREAQTAASQLPHDLAIERLYIHGDPVVGQKRGIALNSASTTIIDSYISDIKAIGQDSQAIMAWNGPGPFIIKNNFLEAACENVMFGGADPAAEAFIPSDITFSFNTLSKPVAWRGKGWSVKNLLELKNARRVRIESNVLDTVWADAQVGYAVVLTVRNQDLTAPYSTVEDVAFEGNTIRHMGGGVQILGRDDQGASAIMHNVSIKGNTFEDIDPVKWGGTGRQVFISGGPQTLTIENNNMAGANLNTFLSFDDEAHPSTGLKVLGNRAMEGAYGIIGSGGTPGIKSLEQFAPGYSWTTNTIVRTVTANNINYPASTVIVVAP